MKPAPKMPDAKRQMILVVIVAAILGAGFLGAVTLRWPGAAIAPDMIAVDFGEELDKVIWVQSHEVTITEWNACNDAGACALRLRLPAHLDPGKSYPATGLSWVDANEYLTWINQKTGHLFRLPTTSEWFAVAKDVLPQKPDPIFTDPDLTWASAYLMDEGPSRALVPSGSFAATAHGIWDLDGNVWEWTQDCYAGDAGGTDLARCPAFFAAGEHIAVMSYLVRDPARGGCAVGAPPAHLGLRLVSDAGM